MLPVDGLNHVGLVGPKPYVVPVTRQKIRQRGAPRTGSDHRATHQVSLSFFTNRSSSPRRRRPILARCVQNTKAAMITLAMKTGDRGSRYHARIAIARTAAPRRKASLTYRVTKNGDIHAAA